MLRLQLLFLFLSFSSFLIRYCTSSSPPGRPTRTCGEVNISNPFWLADDNHHEASSSSSSYCCYQGFGISCRDRKTPILTLGKDSYTVTSINYDTKVILLADIGEFELGWRNFKEHRCDGCQNSGGVCGYKITPYTDVLFFCYCGDETHEGPCENEPKHDGPSTVQPSGSKRKDKNKKRKRILIGVTCFSLGSIFVGGLLLLLVCFHRRKKSIKHRTIESFLNRYEDSIPKRYAYSDVKKMTKSFSEQLGHGGFGSVFLGKLSDGHRVAVKVLKDSKGNGEDFINEVASIGRTSHVNVVALLGFCSEGSKRALLYDFMSNGSLDKYINSKTPDEATLTWKKLYEIAVGIARGLEYLHRGCNTRIVHFDIKPHNILLDQDFCPKISDFGLAKLCPNKGSIISVSGARGTIGYIAPEVFSRSFGVVSSKSDVYSFGMMILEMFVGKKNFMASTEEEGENYFPQSIYKLLEQDNDGKYFVSHATTKENIRKVVIVGLWCIQPKPQNRPPMSKVLEMLEGNVDELSLPPITSMFSPTRSFEVATSLSS